MWQFVQPDSANRFAPASASLLPWNPCFFAQFGISALISLAIGSFATAPFVGPYLATILRGGAEIGPDTLARFYSIHMLLVPGALIGLIGLHLYLIVRLGVTSPPWSKEAAGGEPDDAPPPSRSGLVQPGPRAAGVRRRPTE